MRPAWSSELESLPGDRPGPVRVSISQKAGKVFVSSTVKDLVAGPGIEFDDRGTHALKGVPVEWRVFAVTTR
jgi:class 3 adenylate cyclase